MAVLRDEEPPMPVPTSLASTNPIAAAPREE